ncbi:MAG: nucleoside phosphorylase [Spirochaetes bacterium]|nr:nucleoside phosphorylase [Spirochaetota bacterium]
MSLPRFPEKFTDAPLFNPGDFLRYLQGLGSIPEVPPPEGLILGYQASLVHYVMETCSTRPAGGYFGDKVLYMEDDWAGGGKLAVAAGFGVGAPAAAVMLEELIAWGVKEFISIGTAGSLRADLPPGSLVLCTSAFRDEGTSRHYLAGEEPALPEPGLTSRLEASLCRAGLGFSSGPSWTTDAIYRETPFEVLSYRKLGTLVVEMEASALFAVAAFRKVALASCFSVSDTLAELAWRPEFHAEGTKEGLRKLLLAAVDALSPV